MPFLKTSLKVETEDGRNVTFLEPLSYQHEDGTITTAPTGTQSDGLSGGLIPCWGWYWLSALLHDYLYRRTYLPRQYCDELFLEAMLSLATTIEQRAEARGIYAGVRLAGQRAFDEDRAALQAMQPK